MGHRVLVIGVGSIGERHLRCFRATGRAEVALVEVRDEVRCTVAERYGVEHAYADLDAALGHRPDVAVIATPAPLHVAMATRLAEAGVHVLIEKPLSVGLDGIDRLCEAVEQRGVTAGVAYVYRCHPLLAAMRQAVCGGRIGRPVELVAVAGQHFPTYRPAYREIYYADRAAGGGAIQDALTHLVNAGEWLLGRIDRLVADAAHQVLEGVSVEDTVHLLARHQSVLASYSLNQHQAPNEMTITVTGTQGTARCEFHRHRWRLAQRPDEPWQDEAIVPLERDTLFIAQANAFLDAVEGRGPVLCSLDEGIQTLRANLAALESLEHGAWETIGGSGFGVQDSGFGVQGSGFGVQGSGFGVQDTEDTPSAEPRTLNPEPSLRDLFDLTGRVALITGGTGHLGSAMSRALAEAGACVVVASRDASRAWAAAEALPRPGSARHYGVALDQLDPASIEHGFGEAIALAGRVDVLVNNGHEADAHDWTDVTAEQFTRQMSNATGYFLLARLARNHALQRGGPASIVLLGSMYGQVASYPDAYEGVCPASPVAYHALKGGIIQMTRHLAAYWARDRVRVNCLSPGPFPSAKAPQAMVQRLCTKLPMGRMGVPFELKGAIVFLASDASSFVTGQNLTIDGGWTCW